VIECNSGDRSFVVIAAYNEELVIAQVIGDVSARGYRIVVVVDGATDRTAEIAAGAGAIVLKHPVNLGQGAALQTGIEFVLSSGAEFIVTFDADGQHQAADITKLLDALREQDADFALGSRFLGSTDDLPLTRMLLLRVATWFTRAMTGLRITDAHNGLRAMTRRGASTIHLHQNGMAHASEILQQIAASGLRYVEVPVLIRYSRYSLSKGQKISNLITILVDLFARRLHR
jgi:glycosyltransferase involved in cell wall biosynthesis